jgi:hypothetical protein
MGNQQLFIGQLIKVNKTGNQNGTANDRSLTLNLIVQYLLSIIIMMSIAKSKFIKGYKLAHKPVMKGKIKLWLNTCSSCDRSERENQNTHTCPSCVRSKLNEVIPKRKIAI